VELQGRLERFDIELVLEHPLKGGVERAFFDLKQIV